MRLTGILLRSSTSHFWRFKPFFKIYFCILSHADLKRQLKQFKGDKPKRLNLLRGFFFWMQVNNLFAFMLFSVRYSYWSQRSEIRLLLSSNKIYVAIDTRILCAMDHSNLGQMQNALL